ncbi:hypothetical protein HELRODRAFT_192329 [Helobdella robusta]|uniref:Riboflavin transporter n=1 Tax=Helobdella robusta TaxID=6412 RepID=T1FTU1_HELRO|nr:hypothetical protein HELRODRAFT_192329 [Helobdella robusta]ESO01403.1 hypothetical protein HELRODRAFT_192329 [Helobdella robusta]
MGCTTNHSVIVPVFALISMFSLSSWINVVGLWVELPIMVQKLPERWNLPSYMTLVIQCCNIAPAIYTLAGKIKCRKKQNSSNSGCSDAKRDVALPMIIILISISSALLNSFFWDRTAYIGRAERSVALMFFLSLSSVASCLSALVYLPYMARYPSVYLSAFYFGQGLSGLLPGLIGLGQGLGGNPTCANVTVWNSSCLNATFSNCSSEDVKYLLKPVYPQPKFSVQIFLILISLLLVVSFLAFYLLNFSRLNQYQLRKNASSDNVATVSGDDKTNADVDRKNNGLVSNNHHRSSGDNKEVRAAAAADVEDESKLISPSPSSQYTLSASETNSNASTSAVVVKNLAEPQLSKSHLAFYLSSIVAINMATNGIIPATQSYTCLPYSNVVYTLTVRLSSVVGSLSSLSSMFIPKPSIKVFFFMILTALSVVVFHVVIAVLSPTPPLVNTVYGPILIVCTALIMTSLFSFAKVTAASRMHAYGGRRALKWCGAVTQLGSFLGAMLAFALINWTSIFTSISPCSAEH